MLGSQPLWCPPPLSLLLLFCPVFSGTALVLLGSRILWVPPHPRCGLLFCPGFSGTPFCFLASRFLWSLPTPCVLLLFCPGFSGTDFFGLESRLLSVSAHLLCALAFLAWFLWDSFWFLWVPDSLGLPFAGSGLSVSFHSFPEMHGLRDFGAALDSVALISLINYISRVLAVATSGYFGRASLLSGFRHLRAPPIFLSAFAFFCPGLSGTAFVLLGSRFFWILPSIVRFCVLLSQLVWDSFLRVLAHPGPFPFFSQDGWSG